MLKIVKPDKNFITRTQELCKQVKQSIQNNANYNTESLKNIIADCKSLAADNKLSQEEAILRIIPQLSAVYEQINSAYDSKISNDSIQAAIIACQRVVLNWKKQNSLDESFMLLTATVIQVAMGNKVHIFCQDADEANAIFNNLQNVLLKIDVDCNLLINKPDADFMEESYKNTSVLCGAFTDFINSSSIVENVITQKSLQRNVAIFTNMDLVSNFDAYRQSSFIGNTKYVLGMVSVHILAGFYPKVLGFGGFTNEQVLKKTLSDSISTFDYENKKTTIKRFKTVTFYNLLLQIVKNYRIEYRKFGRLYNSTLQECISFANEDIIAARFECLREDVIKFFAENPSETHRVVDLTIVSGEMFVSVPHFAVENNEAFINYLVSNIHKQTALIAWSDVVQDYISVLDYYLFALYGRKNEIAKPNIYAMANAEKAVRKANGFTVEVLKSL